MAGCSSSIRIAYFKNLQKEAVLSRFFGSKSLILIKFQHSSINRLNCSNLSPDGHLLSRNKSQRLVIVNVINPEAETQSGAIESNYVGKDVGVVERNYVTIPDNGKGSISDEDLIDGSGDNGKSFSGGGGGGGGGEENEFGPLLKFEDVIRETEARGVCIDKNLILVLEAERPGSQFSVNQRVAPYFYKGIHKSEDDIPVSPLVKSAALWGVFLAVSSNIRYQIINGLERLVEASPVAKKVPSAALAFTVGVRFANNVYGGMQFVDWARWSSVQ